jgi:hypothetical protein
MEMGLIEEWPCEMERKDEGERKRGRFGDEIDNQICNF